MVEIEINVDSLREFIDRTAAEGVTNITSDKKVKNHFFKYFYLNVDEENQELSVKANDSAEKRTLIKHKLGNVKVIDGGKIPIANSEIFIDLLDRIPRGRLINFTATKDYLSVNTVDDPENPRGYRFRQPDYNEEQAEKIDIGLEGSLTNEEIIEYYHWEDDKPKITIPDQGSAVYDCAVEFEKGELMDVIDDSIRWTKDQDISVTMKDGNIIFRSGKKADNKQGEIIYDKEIENEIEFENQLISVMQVIVPHLFDKSTWYFRLSSDGVLKFYVHSKKGAIELNFMGSGFLS
ncbi:MAG: hypothetical protein ACOC4M_15980 [Promethearchaeia archaeon]